MADEKKQELSLEDLESVGGGVQHIEKRKEVSAVATSDEDTKVAFSDGRGKRVADQIW